MMEWTTEKPTKPGWYYVRHPDSRNDPWIVEILDGDPIADGGGNGPANLSQNHRRTHDGYRGWQALP